MPSTPIGPRSGRPTHTPSVATLPRLRRAPHAHDLAGDARLHDSISQAGDTVRTRLGTRITNTLTNVATTVSSQLAVPGVRRRTAERELQLSRINTVKQWVGACHAEVDGITAAMRARAAEALNVSDRSMDTLQAVLLRGIDPDTTRMIDAVVRSPVGAKHFLHALEATRVADLPAPARGPLLDALARMDGAAIVGFVENASLFCDCDQEVRAKKLIVVAEAPFVTAGNVAISQMDDHDRKRYAKEPTDLEQLLSEGKFAEAAEALGKRRQEVGKSRIDAHEREAVFRYAQCPEILPILAELLSSGDLLSRDIPATTAPENAHGFTLVGLLFAQKKSFQAMALVNRGFRAFPQETDPSHYKSDTILAAYATLKGLSYNGDRSPRLTEMAPLMKSALLHVAEQTNNYNDIAACLFAGAKPTRVSANRVIALGLLARGNDADKAAARRFIRDNADALWKSHVWERKAFAADTYRALEACGLPAPLLARYEATALPDDFRFPSRGPSGTSPEEKVAWLRRKAPALNEWQNIKIERDKITADPALMSWGGGHRWQRKFFVKYKGEEGVDGGGLTKEYLALMFRDITSAKHAVFSGCEDGDAAQVFLNPQVAGEPIHEQLGKLRYTGRLVAKMLTMEVTPPVQVSPALLALALGKPVTFEQFAQIDGEKAKTLGQIRDSKDVASMGLSYCSMQGEPLVPGGEQIPITSVNQAAYVDALVQHEINTRYKKAIQAFASGLFDVLPAPLLDHLTAKDFAHACNANAPIDVDAWEKATKYVDGRGKVLTYRPAVIDYFWTFVRKADRAVQSEVLRMVMGATSTPAVGFAGLRKKFTIEVRDEPGRIPASHTCANTLHLQNYPSAEVFEAKMKMFLTEGGPTFTTD